MPAPPTGTPAPAEPGDLARLRGQLFTDLDRLAFALEMEMAEQVAVGKFPEAETRQHMRLGVRLAQRLVSGIWADEVHTRINQWSGAYQARLGSSWNLQLSAPHVC